MLDAFLWLFGEGQDLASWQMAARGAAMFFIALVLIRVSGRRSFGQGSAFRLRNPLGALRRHSSF